MTEVLCPGCRRERVARQLRTWPFCSERCRDGDLTAWIEERYRVPLAAPEEPAGEDAADAPAESELDG